MARQDEDAKHAHATERDVSAVRLALARNLARAQIAAGCADIAAA
jgi:hypothetical protein